jgi:hypothetical protein
MSHVTRNLIWQLLPTPEEAPDDTCYLFIASGDDLEATVTINYGQEGEMSKATFEIIRRSRRATRYQIRKAIIRVWKELLTFAIDSLVEDRLFWERHRAMMERPCPTP